MTPSTPTIEALCERYELFLFDQFGVLHDGVVPYPGMRDTLSAIKRAECAVGVVTNSGKRADYNRARLDEFGFDALLIDVVASSGEVAWQMLAEQRESILPGLKADQPARVLVVQRGADRGFLASLPLLETDDPTSCDLVLISGAEPEEFSLGEYQARLAPAALRGVPALCTNPDQVMLLGQGRRGFGAGVIAEAYVALGGPVTWIGKPYPAIYEHALTASAVSGAKTLCIGDSIEHDIAGAAKAGCDSLLVRTGIHAEATDAEREALYLAAGVRPTWILAESDQA